MCRKNGSPVAQVFAGAVQKWGRPAVEVEQAIIDFNLIEDYLTLRAGVLLVPMGIINQWHEPPIFNGVERPSVDKVVIPSTWREPGIGLTGRLMEGLTYELYLITSLNPLGFSSKGIRSGRQHVAKANAKGLGVTGRIEYEPALGTVLGLSGYYSAAGPNGEFKDANGDDLDLDIGVAGFSFDARTRWKGLEARAVAAMFMIGDTDKLRESDAALDVGSQIFGAYGEVGFNVLSVLDSTHALVPFVRYEYYDTLFGVEGRDETDDDKAKQVTEVVAGLNYRPVDGVSFKTDLILKYPGKGLDSTTFNVGVGVMF